MQQTRRSLLGTTTALLAAPALAQERWPNRPITLVLAQPPGGATDIVARRLSPRLERILETSIVVDNRPGASGTIGAAFVVRARPDGHTLFFGGDQSLATGALENVPYDGTRDLAPVSLVSLGYVSVIAGPRMPAQTFPEFLALLKADPGKYEYGTPGEGSIMHLGGEMLKRAAGIDMLHVPYRGGAPAATAVIRGEVALQIGTVGNSMVHVRNGAMRILATFTEQRLPATPDVPTATECGVPLTLSSFTGVFAPIGTPTPVVETLRRAITTVLQDAAFKGELADIGVDAATDTGAAAASRIIADMSASMVAVFRPERGRTN